MEVYTIGGDTSPGRRFAMQIATRVVVFLFFFFISCKLNNYSKVKKQIWTDGA